MTDRILDPSLRVRCLQSHWDATAIYRLTVPQGPSLALPTDPRPWTKVCLQYVNSDDGSPAPSVPNDVVFPSGGEFYPPTRYSSAIDNESKLRRLDRPLGTDRPQGSCDPNQYAVPLDSDTYSQRKLLPIQDRKPMKEFFETRMRFEDTGHPTIRASVPPPYESYLQDTVSQISGELEAPQGVLETGANRCMSGILECASVANPAPWNNATKLQKFNQTSEPCASISGYGEVGPKTMQTHVQKAKQSKLA